MRHLPAAKPGIPPAIEHHSINSVPVPVHNSPFNTHTLLFIFTESFLPSYDPKCFQLTLPGLQFTNRFKVNLGKCKLAENVCKECHLQRIPS